MLASPDFNPLSSAEQQFQLNDVILSNVSGDNGFYASSDNSDDSPTSSFGWVCPDDVIKQQEQSPPDEFSVAGKAEDLSGSEDIAEDEYKQASMKNLPLPAFDSQQQQQQPQQNEQVLPILFPQPQPAPVQQQPQTQFNPVQQGMQQPMQQTFFQPQPVCVDGVSNIFPRGCPVVENPAQAEKDVKLESIAATVPRRKGYRQSKLADSIAGSPPLPPDLELPAILGGKLPPRTFKTSSKRKHVFTERELRSRRKRGLPDDSDSESEERRLVRLPRRSLLTITTSQMSHFVSYMRMTMQLTPSQQDELSRQKRLVKNRECACRFRAKKELTMIEYRERVNELEGDLEALRAENERLRQALKEASLSKDFLVQQPQPQQQQQTPAIL